MTKNKFHLLLGVLFLLGCSNNTIPALPIDSEKLVHIMADAYLAEAAAQGYGTEVKDSVLQVYYQQIFTIHGIDQVAFDSAINIVKRHPKLAESVYAAVERHLEALEKEQEN